MITQALKRWFANLFSWWPWKRSFRNDPSQSVNNLNLSAPQDASWNMLPEGPVPQLGITSVVVEQERDDEAASEDFLMQHPPHIIEGSISPSASSATKATNAEHNPPTSAPTFEQKLHFLRYLVHQGIVNEGFADGHTPRQYKRRKQ